MGITSGRHLLGLDLLRRTAMGEEDDDGLHQYLLVDRWYQCELYAGSGS
jgi:hypothetical protein